MNESSSLSSTVIYGLIYGLAISFLFFNTLLDLSAEGEWLNRGLVFGAIGIILFCPTLVDRMYRAGMMRSRFRWLMVVAYLYTIIILGLCAVSWYLVPENSRWEPLTLILGFTTSWITLLQNRWAPEDRILNVFHLEAHQDRES